MLIIKRYSIDNTGDVFNRILSDIEPLGYLSNLDRLFREEFIIKKTWIGKADRHRNSFKIMRTKAGFFRTGVSMTEISGQLTQDKSRIEIKIKSTALAVITLIWLTLFFGFLIALFFNDWIWWTVLVGVTIIHILLFVLDYRATEDRFTDYIDALRNNALQQKAISNAG